MSQNCEKHQGQECDCAEQCVDGSCDCGCGCCGDGSHFQRRYQTKEEEITELENYLKDLKLEVQAVEEHLTDLRK